MSQHLIPIPQCSWYSQPPRCAPLQTDRARAQDGKCNLRMEGFWMRLQGSEAIVSAPHRALLFPRQGASINIYRLFDYNIRPACLLTFSSMCRFMAFRVFIVSKAIRLDSSKPNVFDDLIAAVLPPGDLSEEDLLTCFLAR